MLRPVLFAFIAVQWARDAAYERWGPRAYGHAYRGTQEVRLGSARRRVPLLKRLQQAGLAAQPKWKEL